MTLKSGIEHEHEPPQKIHFSVEQGNKMLLFIESGRLLQANAERTSAYFIADSFIGPSSIGIKGA